MANGDTKIEITADVRSFEVALKKIERSIGGLGNRLDKGFSLFDVRIGVMKKNLAALDTQAEKTGGLLSLALESLGAISRVPMLDEFGKKIGKIGSESERLKANFNKFFAMRPSALVSEFGTLESQIQTIRAATDAEIPVRGISDDLRLLSEERKQVVDALIEQANGPFTKLGNLTSDNGALPDTPQVRMLLDRLKEFQEVFQRLRAITEDPDIGAQIDSLPFFDSLPRRRRGALEPREPREVQLTAAGAVSGAGNTAAAVERTDQALSQQAETVQRLNTAARDLGFTFASAFEDAVVEGRRLSDVLEGLEQDILRILTRKLVTGPLAGAVTGLLDGGLGALAGEFHGGGRVGSTPISGRVVPASVFDGAPRFAGGGLVGRVPRLGPGEVPAILHRGEVVRTPAQETALQSGASGRAETRVIVNIQTPNPRAFNESRGQIQAMLADAVRAGQRNR